MVRVTSRLLVFGLVPVLLIAGPAREATAAAADSYGSAVETTYQWGTSLDAGATGGKCNVRAYWAKTDISLSVKLDGSCNVGWFESKSWDVSYAVNGKIPNTNNTCTAYGSQDGLAIDPTFHVRAYVAGDGSAGCNFDQLCMRFKRISSIDSLDSGSMCRTLAIGGPTAAPVEDQPMCSQSGSNSAIFAERPKLGEKYKYDSDYYLKAYRRDVTWKVTAPANGSTSDRYVLYAIVQANSNRADYYYGDTISQVRNMKWQYNNTNALRKPTDLIFVDNYQGRAISPGQTMTVTKAINVNVWSPPYGGTDPGIGADDEWKVIGIGVYRPYVPSGQSLGWGQDALPNEGAGNPWYGLGLVGKRDALRCAAYYGKQLYDDGNAVTVSDIPYGDIPTPPSPDSTTDPGGTNPSPTAPAPEGCGFKFTDPSTWATSAGCAIAGSIGALIGVVRQLIGVVGNVLSAILNLASTILDGLVGLFVPSPGFWDDAFDSLGDGWEDSAVGNWTGVLLDIAPDESLAGCAGPTFTLDLYRMNETVQPFAACGGAGQKAASIVKPLLTAAIVFWGVLSCVRALGSGFGWNMSAGRGGDD